MMSVARLAMQQSTSTSKDPFQCRARLAFHKSTADKTGKYTMGSKAFKDHLIEVREAMDEAADSAAGLMHRYWYRDRVATYLAKILPQRWLSYDVLRRALPDTVNTCQLLVHALGKTSEQLKAMELVPFFGEGLFARVVATAHMRLGQHRGSQRQRAARWMRMYKDRRGHMSRNRDGGNGSSVEGYFWVVASHCVQTSNPRKSVGEYCSSAVAVRRP